MAAPLRELRGPVRALFTDVDGTLTTDGRIEAATWAAIEELSASGTPVVLVTGRPAGWGQAWLATAPVAAVVTENGGVTWLREGRRTIKTYGVTPQSVPEWRRRMYEAVQDVARVVPGTRLSTDSKYREVDLAIDWNEEVSLAPEDADTAVAMLRKAGFTATRSSVHVNFGPPAFDKLSACVAVVRALFGGDGSELEPYVYVGDALNDAPMFGGFPRSVGVANVRAWWDQLPHRPAFVADAAEGAGLREVIAHVRGLTEAA
jgi:HAD superfamily hydrolase (TIGR01484 family)